MALLAEYALTPEVFDTTSYASAQVGGLHLQFLKEVLLQEGLVRDLRHGDWRRVFLDGSRPWHQRGKELLKKLAEQNRLVPFPPARPEAPGSESDWCGEALATHAPPAELAGVVVSDALGPQHSSNPLVSSISKLATAAWWAGRSPSLRLPKNLQAYRAALGLVLRHANSIAIIDPHFDPSAGRYRDCVSLLEGAGNRAPRPRIELHRVAWIGTGMDKRERCEELEATMRPALAAAATRTGLSFRVFLWNDFHDRYLVSDLLGLSVPYGFDTTRDPHAVTTWTRLGRADKEDVEREFAPEFGRHKLIRSFVVG